MSSPSLSYNAFDDAFYGYKIINKIREILQQNVQNQLLLELDIFVLRHTSNILKLYFFFIIEIFTVPRSVLLCVQREQNQ